MATLQEIQQENRKLIIKACNPDFDPERFNYPAYQIRLSKVLLALGKTKNKFMTTSGGYICKLDQFIGGEEWQNYSFWDLTKETLEAQSEETQRAINQLLKNENKS
jgi:hypothetical protein